VAPQVEVSKTPANVIIRAISTDQQQNRTITLTMMIRTALFLAALASPVTSFVPQRNARYATCSPLHESMKPVYVGDQPKVDEYQQESPSKLVPLEPVENNPHLNEKKYHWTDQQPTFDRNWDGSIPKYMDPIPQNRHTAFFS
jgi:hypothetical protein